MTQRTRAFRRAQQQRFIARAERVQRKWWAGCSFTEAEVRASAVRLADNLSICSCVACGNPRRLFGRRTLQELRAANVETYPQENEQCGS